MALVPNQRNNPQCMRCARDECSHDNMKGVLSCTQFEPMQFTNRHLGVFDSKDDFPVDAIEGDHAWYREENEDGRPMLLKGGKWFYLPLTAEIKEVDPDD